MKQEEMEMCMSIPCAIRRYGGRAGELEECKMCLKKQKEVRKEKLKEEICDKYCHFPYVWDAEEKGMELSESNICKNCPVNKL